MLKQDNPFKEIKQIAEDVYRVTSEPGDATRYLKVYISPM